MHFRDKDGYLEWYLSDDADEVAYMVTMPTSENARGAYGLW